MAAGLVNGIWPGDLQHKPWLGFLHRVNLLELISKVGFYISHEDHEDHKERKEHKVVIVNTFFFVRLAVLPAAGRFVGKITFEMASKYTSRQPNRLLKPMPNTKRTIAK
jgi:hypothetical protein